MLILPSQHKHDAFQCVTNTIFRPEYKCKYTWVKKNWRIQKLIYLAWQILINTNIFRFPFFDKYKYKYIWIYHKWANVNMNTIIRTDICEYKYKYKCYPTKNKNNIYFNGYKKKTIKVCKLMHILAIIHNVWCLV